MQRLFSIFPSGLVGAALLVFRVSVAFSLLIDGSSHFVSLHSLWTPVLLVLAACLLPGFMTPFAGLSSIVIQIAMLMVYGGADGRHVVCSIVNCGVLSVLGPGAYSIDARLFGRRLLTVPPRK